MSNEPIYQCLCGAVKFNISNKIPNLYQCHCTLCQKISGSNSNTATFIDKEDFSLESGESSITHYEHPSGFRSNFCSVCGCPVPNIIKGTDLAWIPAGLLGKVKNTKIIAHIHIHSKAEWDIVRTGGVHYDEAPEISKLNALLNSEFSD